MLWCHISPKNFPNDSKSNAFLVENKYIVNDFENFSLKEPKTLRREPRH